MTRPKSDLPVLDWSIDVGLVTEPLILVSLIKVMMLAVVLPGVLLAFLLAVDGDAVSVGSIFVGIAIAFAVIVVLGLLAATVILRNRFSTRYVIDHRGVRQSSVDHRADAASTAAVVAGVVAGSPGTVGAGLIAMSQADRSVAWSAVASVRRHPARHAIALSNSWRTVMLIFCPPQIYETVAARVASEVAAHAGRRKTRRNPLPGLMGKTVLIALACLPFFALPHPFELDLLAPLLTLCFALTALWLVPLFGAVSIGGLVWMWVVIALRIDAGPNLSRPDVSVALAVTFIATIVLTALIVGLMRGTVRSGLFGDEEDLEFGADQNDG